MTENYRKLPRQKRSQATVEAILTGAAQILAERGYERMTTAAVAERAGVSIGSLYQYFPDKVALASAVLDHSSDGFAASFEAKLELGPATSLLASIDAMIAFARSAHKDAPAQHRALDELAARLGRTGKTREISARIAAMIEARLALHAEEIAADIPLSAAAALIQIVLESVTHRALENHPVGSETGMMEQSRRMILAYLRHPETIT
ncbi:TetR/AcrR family transcriptional regulator [Devosia sediminis]|uniref:TetR/AcrR family transcriptional regulator n=1 Tax=Devosia sediminis TaxID=2798801 RepID=UPI002E2D8B71|nr:TetR/AcrR family transcriptional regulator [Devosia sediminis]